MNKLSCSIVLYRHSYEFIAPLLDQLSRLPFPSQILVLDQSPSAWPTIPELPAGCSYRWTGENRGYGAGHNVAMKELLPTSEYHLIVNPDIRVEPDSIASMIAFMERDTEVGMLMPLIRYPDNRIQRLCKLLPTPLDVFSRRFLPASLIEKAMHRYELIDSGYNRVMRVPYLSGCFMLCRSSALLDVGLFDERYFMYFEDTDLTRRMYARYKAVFYPNATAIHYFQKGSYRSLKLMLHHIAAAIRYFNKWGWFFDRERSEFNSRTLKELSR